MGVEVPSNPINRHEQYLAKIAGQAVEIPAEPLTREEAYLDYIAKHGGGGGGTTNYNQLENKPQIAGTELQGNKSLADLGIASAQDVKKEFIGTEQQWNALSAAEQKAFDTYQITDDAIDANIPATPSEDGDYVLHVGVESGVPTFSWGAATSGGFNLPVICAYGNGSGIGGSSAKYNYWFTIWSSSSHTIPSASARSNCTVSKVVDHKESRELAFALYLIEKTDENTGASINESNVDAKTIFGASEPFVLGEFTKSDNNINSLHIETNKPVLLCAQSGLSNALYNIIDTMQKGSNAMLTRCNYSNYDNGEMHILFPEDGEIDLTFTHSTVCAYAEIG